MNNISEYINTVFKEFPEDIAKIKNYRSRYSPFSLLIGEMADILKVDSELIYPVSLVVELVQSTIDIHGQIAVLPETDINNKMSILSGDLLFSHALEKILTINSLEIRSLILNKIAETTKADVLLSIMANSKRVFSLKKYEKMTKLKSGSFTSLAFSVSSHYAGMNAKSTSMLTKIGVSLGLIRQILEELMFFKNQVLTHYNIQDWYFPFLILSQTDWKKRYWEKEVTFSAKDDNYLSKINSAVELLYKQHQSLIEKLPINLKDSVLQLCRLYLKELSPRL